MASIQVVERVLGAIASMFGRHPLWVEDSKKMWMLQLEDVEDRDLVVGCKDLLRKAKTLPTVAQLREVIEANPTTKVGQPVQIDGCGACRGTGMRELARWWVDDHASVRIWRGVAGCDCAKGSQLTLGAFVPFRQIVEQWERNPATTKVFVADRRNPVLSDEQTLTATEREARRARAEKGEKCIKRF
tara:strand:+ start:141 stop:701 length:561 start_codon:yes stop_codon:yes gene_type:complete